MCVCSVRAAYGVRAAEGDDGVRVPGGCFSRVQRVARLRGERPPRALRRAAARGEDRLESRGSRLQRRRHLERRPLGRSTHARGRPLQLGNKSASKPSPIMSYIKEP